MIKIPLTESNQDFSIKIQETVYRMRIRVNLSGENGTFLSLGILDSSGNPLVSGLPLTGGVDLLERFNIGFKGLFALNSEDNERDSDSLSNLLLVVLEDGDL